MSYPMELQDIQERIYKTAKEHGWWDEPRTFGDIVALCHSELSEALEEFRTNKPMVYYPDGNGGININIQHDVAVKPEGVAVEMADCIIRILDWAEHNNINMQQILINKMAYNETRPYRHGGKAL
jgi:NTP pyrophosphatase (non-canonical NTP hydrolase)